MPRNSFRNRAEFGVDVRAQKGFGFGEGRRLIFSTEIFNVFNNANIQYGGDQELYCASADRNAACGLRDRPTRRSCSCATRTAACITSGNFSRTPVFQMQFGVRLQL